MSSGRGARVAPYVWHRRTHRGKVARIARESYLRPGIVAAVAARIDARRSHALLPDAKALLALLVVLEDVDTWPDPPSVLLCRHVCERMAAICSGAQWAKVKRLWMRSIKEVGGPFVPLENVFDSAVWVHRTPDQSLDDSLAANVLSLQSTLAPLLPVPIVTLADVADYIQSHQQCSAILLDAVRGAASDISASSVAKSLYPKHWSEERMKAALSLGTVHRGRVKAARNIGAVIVCEDEDIAVTADHMNRAVDGDIVVVEKIIATTSAPPPGFEPMTAIVDDDDEDVIGVLPDDDDIDEPAPALSSLVTHGRVVGILQRAWRPYAGSIKPEEDEAERRVLFVPMDRNVPRIRIYTRHPQELLGQRIVVRIDNWAATSRYPDGHVIGYLGASGDIEVETAAILSEHGIAQEPFVAEQWVDELPNARSWAVTDEDVASRRDLRSTHVICSIDPPGCVDIDDALSVRDLGDGRVEYGVHIADVTAFVRRDSRLDLEARRRATTVYLVDRRINMLPEVLSENLCSLHENVDRLAVSVMWVLEADGRTLTAPWFGRTIIRSSCALSYAEAQAIADGKASQVAESRRQTALKLRPQLIGLLQLGRMLHAERLEKGALEIESFEVKYRVQDDNSVERGARTVDMEGPEDLEFHEIVAEMMIAANAAVAQQIWRAFPAHALLRHHRPPDEHRFTELEQLVDAAGGKLDATNNKSVARSLHGLADAPGAQSDPWIAKIVKSLTARVLTEAKYCCSLGMPVAQFEHYGLAVPFYTHFTSPIRRYADVIVHRLLLASLIDGGAATEAVDDSGSLNEICDHINVCNRSAKLAQRDSADLFWSLYITTRGAVTVEAVIFSLSKNSVVVFMPEFFRKAVVPLVDRDGLLRVADVASGPPCSLEVTGTTLDVSIPSLSISCRLRLFDRVRVRVSPFAGNLIARIAPPRVDLVWDVTRGDRTPLIRRHAAPAEPYRPVIFDIGPDTSRKLIHAPNASSSRSETISIYDLIDRFAAQVRVTPAGNRLAISHISPTLRCATRMRFGAIPAPVVLDRDEAIVK